MSSCPTRGHACVHQTGWPPLRDSGGLETHNRVASPPQTRGGGLCCQEAGGTGTMCWCTQVQEAQGTASVFSQVTPGTGRRGGLETETGRIWLQLLREFRGQPSPAEGQTINSVSFMDPTAVVAAPQLCLQATKAATAGVEVRQRGCVPAKLSLWTRRFAFCFFRQLLNTVKAIFLSHGYIKTGGGPERAHNRGWWPPALADTWAGVHETPAKEEARATSQPGCDLPWYELLGPGQSEPCPSGDRLIHDPLRTWGS